MKNKVLKTIVIIMLIMVLTAADLIVVGMNLVTYATESKATKNVEFVAYFKTNEGEVAETQYEISNKEMKLYMKISVGAGVGFDGVIKLENSNFKFKEDIISEGIGKIEGNAITLNRIRAGKTIEIAVGIEPIIEENYGIEMLNKESVLKLTGKHINSEEETTSISEESKVTLTLLVPSNIAELTKLEAEVITNKIYQIGNENKRIVQIELNSGVLGNIYPIETSTFSITLPEGVTGVDVISKGTYATDGNKEKTLAKGTDYTWNEAEKTVQIIIKNTIKNGKISWNQNGKDCIVVTLTLENTQQLGTEEYSINSNIDFYGNLEKNVTKQSSYNLKEELNGAITSSIENQEEIYKGKLYSKEEREYNSTTNIEVNYANLLESVALEEKTAYKTETEQKAANITYSTTTISKTEFESILGTGENAKLTIKNQNGITIKEVKAADFYTEANEPIENLIIEYPDGESSVTSIIVELTKAVNTGIIRLKHKKIIKPESYDISVIKTFKGLVEQINVKHNNEIQNTTVVETELKEITAEVGVTVTPEIISAEENNEMQISITLKTDNEKYELYENPQFKFTLPEGIIINSVGEGAISATNKELKVSKLDVNGREITLVVAGKQDKYVTSDINPQITFKANVSVNKLMANKQESIEVEYLNGYVNENNVYNLKTAPISIIASNEKVMTHLKVENYNGVGTAVEKYSDSSVEVKAKLPIENPQILEVPVKYTIVNNYDSAITVTAKIVASYEDNKGNDKELINYNNSQVSIEAGKMQVIEQLIQIPEGLDFSEKVEIQTLVEYTYTNSSTRNSVSNNIVLATEENEGLRASNTVADKVQLETFAQLGDGTGIKENDEIYNEQIVTYVIKVTNISNETISNLKVTNKQLNGNIYDLKEVTKENYVTTQITQYEHKYAELEDTEKAFTVGTLKPGETKQLECRVVVKKTEQSNVTSANISIAADGIEEQSVQKIANGVKDAELKITTEKIFTEEVSVYTNSTTYTLTRIKNLTNSELRAIKGKIYLSDGITFTENSKFEVYDEESNSIDVLASMNYNKEKNYIDFEITNIEAGKEIKIKLTLQTKSLPIKELKTEETVYSTANSIVSNKLKINVEQIETAFSIVQKTNIGEGQKVKNGETIIITGQIKNEGQIDTKITIRDSFPKGFNVSKVEIIRNGESTDKTVEGQNENIFITSRINKGETITLRIEITVDTASLTTNEVTNQIHIISATGNITSSNEVTIQIDSDIDNDIPTEDLGDENPGDEKPGDEKPGDEKPGDEKPEDKEDTYTISGYAWVDKNQNELRDEEEVLKGITVKIIDLNNNNMFLKDENGKDIEVKTNENGEYEIKNLLKGKYNVIFKYDTSTYELKENTGTKDYIIESTKEKVAITDNIDLKSNKTADLVLNEVKEFNLKIDKYISKVVVQTVNETKTSTYTEKQLAREEIQKKYLTGATVLVEYTMKISNIGELAGFATEIVDYIPEDMKFYSELNTLWYAGEDGNLYNTSLASSTINPGEAKTIKLILSKTMSKENTGTTTNIAEISEIMNNKGYEDIDLSNNSSKAEIIVNTATGEIITYIIAITNGIVILFVGMYFIKKKVIGKE